MKAVLDLGTNTFHLLIAEVLKGEIVSHYEQQIAVKIGAGGINQGYIAPAAYQRGIQAVAELHASIQKYEVKSILATGTSAIRNAVNGPKFLAEVKSKFGIDVQHISGDREAELIYKGVSKSFPFPAEPVVVMDIGGGSVELIIGLQNTILWKQSFEVGAARLLERFNPSNPIEKEEINQIEDYLTSTFKPFAEALVQAKMGGKTCQVLVGSAGSFDTLLDVLEADLKRKSAQVSRQAYAVKDADAELFYQTVIHSTQVDREKMIGLLPFRVDMIVVAIILMRHIAKNYGLNQIICSRYALKEGLLLA
jgi:exopolyphosphatase/guanosine-5'-triphosphate,3'-diphosphate pyrophosphatase